MVTYVGHLAYEMLLVRCSRLR